MAEIRLTQFSHGGGCGCKIAPAVLSEILAGMPSRLRPPALLVGTESSDDAAVWKLNDSQAVIATTDFFLPIVDDPRDFGRIAAANAISDVYAMGGQPLFALAIVGMPVDKLPADVVRAILAGGESVCHEAGIPVAGGHTIDAPEPIYGLVVIGLAHPDRIKRNSDARPGDVLILGKGLGIGALSAALKQGRLDAEGYRQMLDSTTQLNVTGARLAAMDGVHALTDVTGFGLLGHLLEICRGSNLAGQVRLDCLPVLPAARPLFEAGVATGASARNWASYGDSVRLDSSVAGWQRALLTDPQTSGGLLVACDPAVKDAVLAAFRADGFTRAAEIGVLSPGEPAVHVS